MDWVKIKNCIPKKFKEPTKEVFNIIEKNWKYLAEEEIFKNFYPEKLTKKGTLVLKKINETNLINTKGSFNELKKKINSFLGKEFIQKIKFF